MIEICGWLSSICFAVCGIPELISTIKTKKCNLTWGLISMWMGGEVLGIIYVFDKGAYPIIFNYSINFAILCILCYYKFKQKENV